MDAWLEDRELLELRLELREETVVMADQLEEVRSELALLKVGKPREELLLERLEPAEPLLDVEPYEPVEELLDDWRTQTFRQSLRVLNFASPGLQRYSTDLLLLEAESAEEFELFEALLDTLEVFELFEALLETLEAFELFEALLDTLEFLELSEALLETLEAFELFEALLD